MMKRAVVRDGAILACGAFCAMVSASQEPAAPLWPGARYTTADRDRAIERGLGFLYQVAKTPRHFSRFGHDLMWCFYTISATARDPKIRQMAWDMGHERAVEWRRDQRAVPAKATALEITNLVSGNDEADRLGAPDPGMRDQLRRAAARYRAKDYLLFDPVKEPPPPDVPDSCSKCNRDNKRGAVKCRHCGARLEMMSRYDVWGDALVTTYSGDSYGVKLGASYRDVIRWLPSMRPYPARTSLPWNELDRVTYAVTHVVYTLNDYGRHRLSIAWLPLEYEFLKSNIGEAVRRKDVESIGEFMDSLRAFGMTENDEPIQMAVAYLLSQQNPDGSWGDPNDADVYRHYHTTWTAIDGLREYQWDGEKLSFPGLERILGVR